MNRVPVILLTGIVAFLAVSLLSYSSADPPDSLIFPVTDGYENLCGKWGAYTASVLLNALGYSAYLLFVPLITLIYYLWHGKPVSQFFLRKVGFVWVLIAVSGLVCLYSDRLWGGPMIGPGGYLGVTCVYFLNIYFSPVGMTVIFVCTLIGGLVLACDYLIIRIFLWMFGLRPFPLPADDRTTVQRVKLPRLKTYRSVPAFRAVGNRNAEIDELGEEDEQFEPEDGEDTEIEDEDHEVHQGDEEEYEEGEEYEYAEEEDENEIEDDEIEDSVEIADESPTENIGEQPAKPSKSWISRLKVRRPQDEPPEYRQDSNKKPIFETEETEADENSEKEYALPLVELLIESEQHDYDQQIQSAKRMARQLEKAFADYGHTIKVVDIQCGPVIAQYELELERGLRLNKITNLTDDLAVALRVPTVRVVAPIPGKNTVGVEVPNEMRQLVRLREVIEETPEKLKSKMAIPIFLGKDVAGAPMVIDLAQMPHLLIAGRTGTGKSVCLNSIIVSILMTRTPDECRMIMIDPKMVELGQYESIPHLMHPVVTDMKKAEAILAWAVDKMEQRLQILSRARVRQLSEYNALSDEELYRRVKPETDEEWDDTPRSMPYMVIVADEMADLMLTAAKEVETHIIRLAAKSRAVGIHLVLATQKPTVDIITGLIKSNLPARIAFTVATRMDSQVILDRIGAEKLLGNGDLLFLKPGTSQVLRGQGTYVSDPEINEIIADIATDSPDYVTELVELPTGDEVQDFGPTDPRDELFNQGVEYIIRESMRKGNGKGSISWLQRKMKIGYQRSARLFDYMEEDGIVGPGQGQQPRDVLISLQEWRRRLAELKDAEEQTSGFRGQASGRNDEPRSRKPGLKTRKDDAHESDRSPKPKVRPDAHRVGDRSTGTKPKELLTGVPVRSPKPQVEPGVGKIDEVDDSMLAEVRPNVRQRQKPPGGKRLQASDSWLQESASNTNPEVRSPMPNNNVYGVVPVADGDVTDDADGDEWEYEYEYVYEEVDADDGDEDAEEDAEEEDSDEEEGEGEGEEEDWDDGYVDPKARYVEEMNIEDGGEWEAEEDWDETETNQPDEEEYDEYDDEYDED